MRSLLTLAEIEGDIEGGLRAVGYGLAAVGPGLGIAFAEALALIGFVVTFL